MAVLTQCQYGMRTDTVSVYTTFWGFFEQKLNKFLSHFNKQPPKNPDFFIGRQRGIDADTVEPIQTNISSTPKFDTISNVTVHKYTYVPCPLRCA